MHRPLSAVTAFQNLSFNGRLLTFTSNAQKTDRNLTTVRGPA